MELDFIEIILIVLFFQLLTLAPFLLFNSKNKKSNLLLGLFLLAKALCISNFFAFRLKDIFFEYFPHIFYLGSSFTILWGPLLYFYTKSITESNFTFKKQDLLHLIPFIIHFTYFLSVYHLHSADYKRELLELGFVTGTMTHMIYGYIHASIFIYTILSYRNIFSFRERIRNTFSTLDSIKLSWMLFVLTGFTSKWIFDVWYYIAQIGFDIYPYLPLVFSRIILYIFLFIMIFRGLKQPAIFGGMVHNLEGSKRSLSKSVAEKYVEKLVEYMKKEKPYLDPDLNIMDLSEKIKIPHRSLSEIINKHLNQNFYDFINSYRIKESQRLLIEKSDHSKTILEILYEVGYNSKSSFNTAFKKYVGMTPTQFKQQHSLT